MRPSARLLLILALPSVLAACATTGGPVAGTASPITVGAYAGSVVIDNQAFAANLTLRSAGSMGVEGAFRLEGVLTIPSPVEIEGEVEGIAVEEILRLTVEYRSVDGCDGRIDGILDVTREGAALDGPVTVADCGEPVAGRLTLRRREMLPG